MCRSTPPPSYHFFYYKNNDLASVKFGNCKAQYWSLKTKENAYIHKTGIIWKHINTFINAGTSSFFFFSFDRMEKILLVNYDFEMPKIKLRDHYFFFFFSSPTGSKKFDRFFFFSMPTDFMWTTLFYFFFRPYGEKNFKISGQTMNIITVALVIYFNFIRRLYSLNDISLCRQVAVSHIVGLGRWVAWWLRLTCHDTLHQGINFFPYFIVKNIYPRNIDTQ